MSKHIRITNLDHLSLMIEGESLKQKRELLAEAALMTSTPFAKDQSNAAKMAKSLEELANSIEQDGDNLGKKLNEAVLNVESATSDFVKPLREEAARLTKLAAAPVAPRKPFERKVPKATISLEEQAAIDAKGGVK